MGNNVSYESPGHAMLPAQLSGSSVYFVFKARKVIISCLLAVAQETIFNITEGPSLSHFFLLLTTMCLRTLSMEQDLKCLCERLFNDSTCIAQPDVRYITAN